MAINHRTTATEQLPLRLADVVACAQADAADWLARAVDGVGFSRSRYQDWLAIESAACRIAALSLEAVAGWHRHDALQDTAQAWASELRQWVALAAADVRRLDGVTAALPVALSEWHAFTLHAGGSQRAGEVLGAAVLQARLLDGPARPAVAALHALPFIRGTNGYLAGRLHARPDDAARDSLLDAYSNTALIAGAQRGAEWLRDARLPVFAPPAH